MEDRMKRAFSFVRQHLGLAAERLKRQYDIRVRPQKFCRGQWVLYYNPRKLQGRQQKWQRTFAPHLIVKELPPVNYLIQKSKRSRPFVTHVDKLKPWNVDNPPKSWLTADDGDVIPDPADMRIDDRQLHDAKAMVVDIGGAGQAAGDAAATSTGPVNLHGDGHIGQNGDDAGATVLGSDKVAGDGATNTGNGSGTGTKQPCLLYTSPSPRDS